MVNREWAVREGDDGEEEVVGAREEGKIERGEEAAAGRRWWGRKQETCFEILICGSGRGLERRDEKKKGAGEPLKRGNVSSIGGAGARQTAMLAENNWGRCSVPASHLRALISTPPHTAYWRGVYLECSLFPALTQMR